jgi:hypothetical protein
MESKDPFPVAHVTSLPYDKKSFALMGLRKDNRFWLEIASGGVQGFWHGVCILMYLGKPSG